MSAMSNYVKLVNNFDSLNLTTFRANIDAFIDEVNGGKADLVDALYSLTEKEMAFRQDRVNRSMVVISHFPFVKTFDDYDFSYQPRLNRDEVLDLRNLRFVERAENIVFMGTPGTGKTHLAVSVGIECAKSRYMTYFVNCNDLIMQLKKAKHENTLARRLKHFASYSVLIIDEVGFLPIDAEDANLLFQLISMRYERHPTVFTTNKSFNRWGEVFGDPVITNAILDRVLHHSRVFQIVGPSYRMKGKEELFKED
jgi:DNA replication protein DnaC